MANFLLKYLVHKKPSGEITKQNPLDTEDVNSDAILARADLLASETKLEEVRVLLEQVLESRIAEYAGPSIADRPLATAVPMGAFWMAIDTGYKWQSNGTEWIAR